MLHLGVRGPSSVHKFHQQQREEKPSRGVSQSAQGERDPVAPAYSLQL